MSNNAKYLKFKSKTKPAASTAIFKQSH